MAAGPDPQPGRRPGEAAAPPEAADDGDDLVVKLELMRLVEAHAEDEAQRLQWVSLDREVLGLIRRVLTLKRREAPGRK